MNHPNWEYDPFTTTMTTYQHMNQIEPRNRQTAAGDPGDPGQCRHGWKADECPYRYDDSAPMGACRRAGPSLVVWVWQDQGQATRYRVQWHDETGAPCSQCGKDA